MQALVDEVLFSETISGHADVVRRLQVLPGYAIIIDVKMVSHQFVPVASLRHHTEQVSLTQVRELRAVVSTQLPPT